MFTLPKLEYSYDALEPFIDAETMRIHYTKHHQAYVDKLNGALAGNEDLLSRSVENLIANPNALSPDIRTAVLANGGGHINHSLFWTLLKKGVEGKRMPVMNALEEQYGGYEEFKSAFSSSALSVFGSGWAWVVVSNGALEILATPNQNNPLTEGKMPILTIDVWEHAYYLKYQNRRADYIEAFFNVVDWEKVNDLYVASK